MKINSLILFAVFSLFLFSCDDGIKFDNPLDEHNQTAQSDAGQLGGECYRNKTCNEGLICDEENNICVEEPKNTNDDDETDNPSETDNDKPIPDDADSIDDSGDSVPDESDSDDDSADSVPDDDSDSAPENDDDTDSEPDEDEDEPVVVSVTTKCSNIPENAVYNTVDEITQTWNGNK